MTAIKPMVLNVCMAATLIALTLLSLGIGPVQINTLDVISALLSPNSDASSLSDPLLRNQLIIEQIRLPRVVLAILVGMSLGLSGAALQGLFRNPLAEPGLLGVSSSAALGAVLCLYFGIADSNPWWLPFSAMTSATIATLVLYAIARSGASNLTLILAGIALSSLMAALTSVALNLAPNPSDVQDIVLWLLGSLSDRSFTDVQLCLPFVLTGLLLLLASAPKLNALSLGEDEASTLGVDVTRLRIQIITGSALCVGASVAVTGVIGFIGLVVPHILRPLVGFHPGRLLLSSAIGGAILLLGADILLRLVNDSQELMLGVITSLIGAPFFLMLVLRQQKVLS